MMRTFLWAARLLAVLLLFVSPALAQQPRPRPTPPAGQSRAAIANQLQQLMASSGMTMDQVRARLRAQGYSESLLDSYMPGAQDADSTAIPTEDVFDAVRLLGVADSSLVDSLRTSSVSHRL